MGIRTQLVVVVAGCENNFKELCST